MAKTFCMPPGIALLDIDDGVIEPGLDIPPALLLGQMTQGATRALERRDEFLAPQIMQRGSGS